MADFFICFDQVHILIVKLLGALMYNNNNNNNNIWEANLAEFLFRILYFVPF